ncbi:MAG: DUF4369 domain-containing protein [Muribaculaceae bacterium]|nr:DUF4369 domain-containing protein [Muribaculaceae bacterium]
MAKKTLHISLLLLLLTIASSCGRSFKISGQMKNLGTQNVRLVYATEQGVVDKWIVAQDDKFQATGSVDALTVIAIYNSEQSLIARLAVKNGDNISIGGDALEPYTIQVNGSDLNGRWYDFIRKNQSVYNAYNTTMLSTLIETYVSKNPDDVVSTLLVMTDYGYINDREKTEKLLSSINPDARPASIIQPYEALLKMRTTPQNRTRTMYLMDTNGDIVALNTNEAPYSIYYFWNSDQRFRADIIKQLRQCKSSLKNKVQIADINLDGDSTGWRPKVRADSSTWKHYWSPGGPLASTVLHLAIERTPLFIVSDSIGRQHYRGISVQEACEVAENKLK